MLFHETVICFSVWWRYSRYASYYETENIKKLGVEGMKLNGINNSYCLVACILNWSWLCKWVWDGGECSDQETSVEAPAVLPIITLAEIVRISAQWQGNIINWYYMKVVLTVPIPRKGLGSAEGPQTLLWEPCKH